MQYKSPDDECKVWRLWRVSDSVRDADRSVGMWRNRLRAGLL